MAAALVPPSSLFERLPVVDYSCWGPGNTLPGHRALSLGCALVAIVIILDKDKRITLQEAISDGFETDTKTQTTVSKMVNVPSFPTTVAAAVIGSCCFHSLT
jgi:hypothetical protein